MQVLLFSGFFCIRHPKQLDTPTCCDADVDVKCLSDVLVEHICRGVTQQTFFLYFVFGMAHFLPTHDLFIGKTEASCNTGKL